MALTAGGAALVGRAQLLRRVRQALARSGGAVVVGEAGVGKTRLMTAALEDARHQEAVTDYIVGTQAASRLPYRALVDLLPDTVEPDNLTPLDLLRRTAAAVEARGGPGGFVLGVDDAHLLDASSAALVGYLVRIRACGVVVTVRTGVETEDLPATLIRTGLTTRVEVPPLDREDVIALATQVLGGPPDVATGQQLWRLSRGNPLFVHELIAVGLQRGALVPADGLWRVRGRLAEGSRLRDIVWAHMQRLADEERDAVETVALAEPLEAGLLEVLCRGSGVIGAEREGLLTMHHDRARARVRLVHPLHGSVLRAALAPLRARSVYRRLADALEATGARRRDDTLRLTTWRLQAGRASDPRLLVDAARRALQLGDARLALQLGDAGPARSDPDARLIVAEALQACGQASQADDLLRSIHAPAGSKVVAGVTLLRATGLASAFGRADEATRVIDDAMSSLTDTPLHDELLALHAMIQLQRGRIAEAGSVATTILDRQSAPASARLRALLVAVPAWSHAGRTEQAIAAASLALGMVRVLPNSPAIADELIRLGLCLAYGLAGRYDDAEALANRAHLDALEHVSDDLRAPWTAALGHLALARGLLEDADALMREASRLLDTQPTGFGVYSIAWVMGCLAEIAAARGDAVAARDAMDRADAATPEPCFIANREIGRIWTVAVEGRLADAITLARRVADEALEHGSVAFAVTALHDAVRLGGARQVVDRLAGLADRVDSIHVPIYVRHAHSVARGDASALEEVSADFGSHGRLLLAAEAAAEAAQSHQAAGHAGRANAAGLRARALSRRCGGALTPALRFASAVRPLTAREREIAALAAEGLSSRAIAQRFVVSVRTVDNHLQRVYDKLGVRQRSELAAILDGLGGDLTSTVPEPSEAQTRRERSDGGPGPGHVV